MDREIQQRLQRIKRYEKHDDAGYVCRRCGISRPTLRRWWRRYQEAGLAGLESQSRRPNTSPATKVGDREEGLIVELRHSRNLGARRIQSELRQQHNLSLGLATIHKVLQRHQARPVRKYRCKKDFIRYERSTPGDRVQMDTCKIGAGLIQYTAVDDCTRYRVLRLYSRCTAANTLDFIDCVLEEMPFLCSDSRRTEGVSFSQRKCKES
jgi:transposase-like protein